jgi:hypothetical protein
VSCGPPAVVFLMMAGSASKSVSRTRMRRLPSMSLGGLLFNLGIATSTSCCRVLRAGTAVLPGPRCRLNARIARQRGCAGPRHRDRRLRVIDRPSRLFSVRARARESSRVMAKSVGGGGLDPTQRDKQRAATKARWDDPVSGARMRAAIAHPENRDRISAAMKARWEEPAARNKMTASIKASLARPEVRAKIGAATSARWADPVWREKMIAARKGKARR